MTEGRLHPKEFTATWKDGFSNSETQASEIMTKQNEEPAMICVPYKERKDQYKERLNHLKYSMPQCGGHQS